MPIAGALRDYLLERRLGAHLSKRVFGSDWQVRRAAERARERWEKKGLAPLSLHEARHTYASLMIAAGVNAKALALDGPRHDRHHLRPLRTLMPGSEAEGAALLDAYLARSAKPRQAAGA